MRKKDQTMDQEVGHDWFGVGRIRPIRRLTNGSCQGAAPDGGASQTAEPSAQVRNRPRKQSFFPPEYWKGGKTS